MCICIRRSSFRTPFDWCLLCAWWCAELRPKKNAMVPFLLVVAIQLRVGANCKVGATQCYTDVNGARLLPNQPPTSQCTNTMDKQYCAQQCSDLNFTLAGVESSSECYCGNSLPASAARAPPSDCSNPCQGASNETCGGNWKLEVYPVSCGSGQPDLPPKGTSRHATCTPVRLTPN